MRKIGAERRHLEKGEGELFMIGFCFGFLDRILTSMHVLELPLPHERDRNFMYDTCKKLKRVEPGREKKALL